MTAKLWQKSHSENIFFPSHQTKTKRNSYPNTLPSAPIGVMLVDDDKTLLGLAERFLNRCEGIRCAGLADCAEAAFKLIPDVQPGVVLLDVRLPGLSGYECLRQLKSAHPDVPVIMITGHPDEHQLFDLLKAGASGYVTKPFQLREIAEEIHKVVSGGIALCDTAKKLLVRVIQREACDESVAAILSHQEHTVMKCLVRKMRDKEIADELKICIPTVRTYLGRLYKKLGAHSRRQAVRKYNGQDTSVRYFQ